MVRLFLFVMVISGIARAELHMAERYVNEVELRMERSLKLYADELLLNPHHFPPLFSHTAVDQAEVQCEAAPGCLKYLGIGAGLALTPWLVWGAISFPVVGVPLLAGVPVVAGILIFVKDPPRSMLTSERHYRKLQFHRELARDRIGIKWDAASFWKFHQVVSARLRDKHEALTRYQAQENITDWYQRSEEQTRELLLNYLEIWTLTALYRMEAASFFDGQFMPTEREAISKSVREFLESSKQCQNSLAGLLTRPAEQLE